MYTNIFSAGYLSWNWLEFVLAVREKSGKSKRFFLPPTLWQPWVASLAQYKKIMVFIVLIAPSLVIIAMIWNCFLFRYFTQIKEGSECQAQNNPQFPELFASVLTHWDQDMMAVDGIFKRISLNENVWIFQYWFI